MKVSWEVDGVQVVAEKLEDGLEDGMERAVNQILENLKRDAKDRIAVRPHIFTGEVYTSFDDQTTSANSSSGIKSRFINYSKHAGALEHGVHPSKYADGAPPVAALMPWVLVKLKGWDVETSGSGGGSSIKTPTAGPDTTTDDLQDANEDYEADWKRFHENGYSEDELWIGQDVTVYDVSEGSYREGIVEDINLRGDVTVNVDGDSIIYDYHNGTGHYGSGIVVGEDWHSLTESTQRDIAERMLLNNTDIDSDFSSSYKDDIRYALTQYAQNTKDPDEAKRLAMGINSIRKDNSISSRGAWYGDSTGGYIKFNTGLSDRNTIRHELGHAFLSTKGYDYSTGAKHWDDWKGETWNSITKWDKGSLDWNYDDIDKSNWETNQGDSFPHPSTYMVYNEEDRDGVGLYDDVNHNDFDLWEEYVRKSTKRDLQETTLSSSSDGAGGSPDYDPFYTEKQVLDPDGGRARPGDALGFEATDPNDSTRTEVYHSKVESEVYLHSEDQYAIDVSVNGEDKTFPVTDDGELELDELEFVGYLPQGAKHTDEGDEDFLDIDDVPDDPGFYAGQDDVDERFKEALNRHLWREIIATEIGDSGNRGSYYMRWDGYSATNSHETMAHLMAIIFSDGSLSSSEESNLVDLLDTSPELLYMASMKFEFSPEMVAVLEKESGLSFDDLMYDIWREHIK